MSILPLTILHSHPSGSAVPRDSCGGVQSPRGVPHVHVLFLFFFPFSYVAAEAAERMRDIRAPGGRERLY